jgi:hypothetical protein
MVPHLLYWSDNPLCWIKHPERRVDHEIGVLTGGGDCPG